MAAGSTPLVDSLAGIAACARSMVRLCASNPDRFHRHMADELRLNLFEPVPGKPGEFISTLFSPTGEFDLEVEMRASVDGQEQVTVCFDGFRVASCSSSTVRTASTVSVDGTGAGTGETPPWTVDQGEAALWASGAGLAQDDMVGSIREIEAAAHVALEQLAELARYAQSARGAEWQR